MDLPKEHFRALVLCLLGDKDHTKVYEAVAKMEKAMITGSPWSGSSHRGRSSDVPYKRRGMTSSALVPGLGEGVLPYLSYAGTCCWTGYGFLALLS